jgi:hypothetical protein
MPGLLAAWAAGRRAPGEPPQAAWRAAAAGAPQAAEAPQKGA